MIQNQKLQQLIQAGATIYAATNNGVIPIMLSKFTTIEGDKLVWGLEFSDFEFLEILFETKKQAEWNLKTRTARVVQFLPPMWEEFKENKTSFKFGSPKHSNPYLLYGYGNKMRIVEVLKNGLEREIFNFEATEENYVKACEICKKLFLGKDQK